MPCPSFNSAAFPIDGVNPRSITAADFDVDGNIDLAVANFNSDNVSILLGNGTGGFVLAPGSPFPTGGDTPVSIITADFNEDGKIDLAVANFNTFNVSILLGDGTGGFAPVLGSPFPTGGFGPSSIIAADFDGDGHIDFAVSNANSNNVSVFLGNGTGGFAPAPGSPFLTGGSFPNSITAADFNGNGIIDLAVLNQASNNVSVLLGNGAGSFAPAPGSPFPTGGTAGTTITAADFNGDGKIDVVVSNQITDNVSVLLGNGAGSLAPAPGSPFPAGVDVPTSITTADFNCDGKIDFAVSGGNNVSVLLGNGTGSFVSAPGSPFSTGGIGAVSLTAADFNDDGSIDLATANFFSNNVSILINECIPVITCPDDITAANDTNFCGSVVNYPTPMVTDNCIGATASCSPASGSFFPVGPTTVTCNLTDASGIIIDSCSFTVTVNDTQPPVIICPDNITVFNDPGSNGAMVNYPPPTVSDNCPGVTSVCTPASGSFFPPGTTIVTCTATDAAGNTSTCSFNVRVITDPCRFFSNR